MPLFGLIPQGGCRHAGNLAVPGVPGRKDALSHVEVPKHGPNPDGDDPWDRAEPMHSFFWRCGKGLPDKVSWGWWKAEEKAFRAGLGWELHHHTPAAPTPRFSKLIGLAEISFQLCLIKRNMAVWDLTGALPETSYLEQHQLTNK